MTRQNNNPEVNWISTAEAAVMLGVSRVTVFKRIKKGILKAKKIGRNYVISTIDLDRLLRKQGPLTDEEKAHIKDAVKKAVKQYSTTLRLLGKE